MIANIKVKNKNGEMFSNGSRYAYIRTVEKDTAYLYDENGKDIGWTYYNCLEEVKSKRITLQLKDYNGVVTNEDEIILDENDKLIMQFPPEMSKEVAFYTFKHLKDCLTDNSNLVGLPNSITFKVIKVGD